MTEYKLALVGFGGVNRALAQLIAERNQQWKTELGFTLKIVGVTDLFLGSVMDRHGLDAALLAKLPTTKGAMAQLPGGTVDALNEAVIKDCGADIIAEATFTNPVDGEPATSFCRWALERGKHVVTTNKGPIALHGAELKALAQRNNVAFEYEGSVMSGTPSFASPNSPWPAARSPVSKASSTAPPTSSSPAWKAASGSPKPSARPKPWATPKPTQRQTSKATTCASKW